MRYRSAIPLSFHSADMKLPSSQLKTGLRSGSLRIISRLLTAPASEEIATPASMSVVNGVPCELLAIEYAATTAPIPPANAAIGRTLIPSTTIGTPVRRTMVAASPAPDATPIRYGSASGFLNSPWYAAPDIASAAPTIAARTTLGTRNCHSIVSHVVGRSEGEAIQGRRDTSIFTTAMNGMSTEPCVAAKIAVRTTTQPPIASRHQGYLRPISRAEILSRPIASTPLARVCPPLRSTTSISTYLNRPGYTHLANSSTPSMNRGPGMLSASVLGV